MKLSNAFEFPFSVQVTALPATAPLRVSVATRGEAAEENYQQLEAQVQIWLQCAMFGAGGGAEVLPRITQGSLDVYDVLRVRPLESGPNTISFEADGQLFEPAYANLLLHMLLCLAHHLTPLRAVAIGLPVNVSQPEPVEIVLATVSDFPQLARLSFSYDCVDSGSDGVAISIEFARSPNPEEAEVLGDLLLEWQIQGVQGGYLSPPFIPEYFSLVAAEDHYLDDNELIWELDDVSIDRRAFDVLANMLQAYSDRFVRVLEVLIQ